MKQTVILLILFTTCQLLQAQSYRLFDPARQYFYASTSGSENSLSDAIRIDSVNIGPGETVLYNYQIVDSLDSLGGFCSHDPFQQSWMGAKIVERAGGTVFIFNEAGDSIRIETQAGIGALFHSFNLGNGFFIAAEVAAHGPQTILGQSDSVKVFRFTARDQAGNLFSHPMNQKEIHLGKDLGLVQALRFRDFPFDTLELPLGGLNNPDLGRVNIGPREIYDWEVGDTFQYRKVLNIFSQSTDTTLEERVILSKTLTGDTVRYEINRRRWQHNIQWMPFSDNVYTSMAMITETYVHPSGEEPLMPQEFGSLDAGLQSRPATDQDQPTLFWDGDYFGRMQKRNFDLWEYNASDSCLRIPFSFGIPFTSDYAAGVGLVYSEINDPFGTTNSNILCYYNKGGEIWGTWKDFDLLLVRDKGPRAIDVRVFPNPATDRIQIQRGSELAHLEGQFQLIDLAGKVVLQRKVNAGEAVSIDLEGLAPGFYGFALQFETGWVQTGKLVVR